GKDRGVGLAIVKKILSTYPNVRLNTSNQNGLFTQHLEVQE
ncbi:GHKL domain-containing protein, partial [Streptococcus sobrinus]